MSFRSDPFNIRKQFVANCSCVLFWSIQMDSFLIVSDPGGNREMIGATV
jgi:hypothetical protein